MTWMNLKDIMITEISLSQRDKFCMIPLLEISKAVKFTETGSSGFRGLREGEMVSCCSVGIEFQFCEMKKFWRSIVQQCQYT